MYNMPAHQLAWYYQPPWVLPTGLTFSVTLIYALSTNVYQNTEKRFAPVFTTKNEKDKDKLNLFKKKKTEIEFKKKRVQFMPRKKKR